MTMIRGKRGVCAIAAAIVMFGVFPLSATAALIDTGSEMSLFGTYSPSGGGDLATATGLDFPSPVLIASGANAFAAAVGGFATFQSFDFAPPALGTIMTFANGGAFTATSVSVDFQTANALALTFDGFWSLDGFDDTAGLMKLTADAADGLFTFSASGTVAVVPVPGALLLLGSALVGLGAGRRRKT